MPSVQLSVTIMEPEVQPSVSTWTVRDAHRPVTAVCSLCQSAQPVDGLEWCAECNMLPVVCPLCKQTLSFGQMQSHLSVCRPSDLQAAARSYVGDLVSRKLVASASP